LRFFFLCIFSFYFFFFFFFNDTATTEIYTLSLHDALPIFRLQQQDGEERSTLLPAQRDRLPVGGHGERSEQAETSVCGRHRRVIARFQALFSVSSAPGATIEAVNAPAPTRTTSTAANADGTAVAVTAVPSLEGRSHAEGQHLELGTSSSAGTSKTAAITGGAAVAVAAVPSPERRNHAEGLYLELGASARFPSYHVRWLA